MGINWVDDTAAEVVLQDMGIEVEKREINVKDIDKKLSSQNRARAIPLDESRVEGILASSKKGVPIPKIVVRDLGGKYIIAGGNHRFAAMNGEATIVAHVIECSDAEFEIVCRVLNTVVGAGLSKADRIASAIDAVSRLGLTQAIAADLYGINRNDVKNGIADLVLERRLRDINPKVGKNISKTHLTKLGELAQNDNVLRAACNLIAESNCKAIELAEIARLARSKTTESAQVAVFEEALAIRKSESGRKIGRNKRREFIGLLTKVLNLGKVVKWSQLEIEPSEVSTIKAEIAKAIDSLKTLSKVNG